MKYAAGMLMLGTFFCGPAAAAQMNLGDLYKSRMFFKRGR